MHDVLKTVNLEEGMPSVERARTRLRAEVETARSRGHRLLKVVHGYGSSGVGGDLRYALQATLRQMANMNIISNCIYGENWRTSDDHTWELLKKLPELTNDPDLSRGNRGITIVVL